jgi:hypothetical protein
MCAVKRKVKEKTMTTSDTKLQDGRAGFDFLIGSWNIRHRRLREVFKGCTTWDEFEGHAVDRYILGGAGSISEVTLDLAAGPIEGMTIRLFDPKARQWSVYWVSSSNGILTTPMIGGFKDGLGKFYAHEVIEGKHVFSRFLWSEITPNSCHWEQAFSEDGGTTWETNWEMDLTRVAT